MARANEALRPLWILQKPRKVSLVKLIFDVAHFQKLKAKSIGNCIFDDRFSIFVPGNPFSPMFSEADLF